MMRPKMKESHLASIQSILAEMIQLRKKDNCGRDIPSLKLTANAPENRPKPNRKGLYSNHPIFRGKLAVSFREGKTLIQKMKKIALPPAMWLVCHCMWLVPQEFYPIFPSRNLRSQNDHQRRPGVIIFR